MSDIPKFIIDTDPGIDDAMAILMALEQHSRGKIQILAFSLVEGNTSIKYQKINILRILKLFPELYKEIPVYVGCYEGLVHKHEVAEKFHGEDGFNLVQFEDEPKLTGHEVDPIKDETSPLAILRLVNQNPGKIEIITLGPLTNIAMCIKLDKNFISNVKHIYMMGGTMEGNGNTTALAEFNFLADPEAVHVVFKKLEGLSPVKATIASWELCYYHVKLSWDWRLNTLGKIDDSRAKLMNRLEEKWHREREFGDQWVICDQVAMAIALDKDCIAESKDYLAFVELHGIYTRGMLGYEKRDNIKNSKLNVRVVTRCDVDLIKKYLMQGLGHKV